MAAACKNVPKNFLCRLCVLMVFSNTFLVCKSSFSIKTPAAAPIQAFWQQSSSLTKLAGPRTWHKRWAYGLPRATYGTMFHCACCKIIVWVIRGTFWLISLNLRGARDFKFARSVVQRSYMVMVALTQKRSCAQYGWFLPWMVTYVGIKINYDDCHLL